MVQSINIPGIVSSWRLLWNPSLAMPSLIVRGMCGREGLSGCVLRDEGDPIQFNSIPIPFY